ncbi:two-component response regulator [Pseudomonas aeruginosa]|nr:two-component response regulator [Pseudomonas aeruginosa]
MRILVVEDNRDILANLADYLSLKGYTVDCAQDGLSGLHLAATEHYDLIVLDVMLPGIDGYALCRRLREDARRDTPVIMLTARDQLDDRLQGFRSGADDYLVKPFALSELSARIEAVLRRAQGGGRRELSVADLSYDLDTLEVKRAGKSLKLNPIGLKLLAVLMQKSPPCGAPGCPGGSGLGRRLPGQRQPAQPRPSTPSGDRQAILRGLAAYGAWRWLPPGGGAEWSISRASPAGSSSPSC